MKRWVANLELVDGGIHEPFGEGLVDPDLAPKVDAAADYSPQYVAPPFVAGDNAVADEHGGRPAMLGHGPDGVFLLAGRGTTEVVHAGHVSGGFKDGQEDVGFEDGCHVLEHRSDPFESTAGVDVLCGQRLPRSIGMLVELHEYEVPDFEKALVFVGGVDALHALFGSEVVIDLRTGAKWAAGTRRAIGETEPVVLVLVAAVNLGVGKLDLVTPGVVGFFIVEIDGDVETIGGDLVDAGQELPGPGNSFAFEIVTKAEIAEHLEGGEV